MILIGKYKKFTNRLLEIKKYLMPKVILVHQSKNFMHKNVKSEDFST